MRNRAGAAQGERPLTPPDVPHRGPGVPPSPQGAGRFAADVARTGAPPPVVPPDLATVAAAQAALLERRDAVLACIPGAAQLRVQVGLLRRAVDRAEGYPETATLADGQSLPEPVEDCVLAAWDGVSLPAPPNARGMSVLLVL